MPVGASRFLSFGVIGAAVFALGLGIQILLVRKWHFGALDSYLIQGFVSVQISFLLNRFWTWRDVRVSFGGALVKFNIQKIVTTIANTLIYGILVRLELNYIVANVATTIIFTLINYLSADNWIFARPTVATDPEAAGHGTTPSYAAQQMRENLPRASVVVPCKNSQRTIRETVLGLLGQDYPALDSVILVGSSQDRTWQSLDGISDPRLVILEETYSPGRRDPNVKRHRGIEYSDSDIVALADSDIVMPPDWLSKGVAMLAASKTQCVAGGMASIHSSFLGRFIDSTRMGAKTPRVTRSYRVTRRNFGARGRKPPVTANVIMTRRLYEACPLDIHWSYGYEDYEWFWRMTRDGYHILFSDELTGKHHHRRQLIPLCREYLQASDGCARFIKRHPDCPLAIKRRWQARLLPVAVVGAAAVGVITIAVHAAALLGVALAIGVIAAMIWEYLERQAVESLLYPILNVLLGSLFLFGMLRGLMGANDDRLTALVPSNEAVT